MLDVMLQDAIEEHEGTIAWAESAMRWGLGPWDLERLRVRLKLLRDMQDPLVPEAHAKSVAAPRLANPVRTVKTIESISSARRTEQSLYF